MNAPVPKRLAHVDQFGEVRMVSGRGAVTIPSEFKAPLEALCADMRLALDCIRIFGGVPISVAKAILRNIEPAHAAIDMAISGATVKAVR